MHDLVTFVLTPDNIKKNIENRGEIGQVILNEFVEIRMQLARQLNFGFG